MHISAFFIFTFLESKGRSMHKSMIKYSIWKAPSLKGFFLLKPLIQWLKIWLSFLDIIFISLAHQAETEPYYLEKKVEKEGLWKEPSFFYA